LRISAPKRSATSLASMPVIAEISSKLLRALRINSRFNSGLSFRGTSSLTNNHPRVCPNPRVLVVLQHVASTSPEFGVPHQGTTHAGLRVVCQPEQHVPGCPGVLGGNSPQLRVITACEALKTSPLALSERDLSPGQHLI